MRHDPHSEWTGILCNHDSDSEESFITIKFL
jgi:hypothetical protein